MSHWRHLLVGGLVLCAAWVFPAQTRSEKDLEPQLLRLKLTQKALLLEFDDGRRRTDYAGGAPRDTSRTQSIEPGVELGMAGSFYHPLLLDFSLSGELAAEWEGFRYEGFSRGSQGPSGTDENFLQRYHARATLFKSKPYAVSLTGLRNDYDRDLDFFTREQVVSDRYEVRGGYRTRPRTLGFSYAHWKEDITGERLSNREEDLYSFTAARRQGRDVSTELDYTLRDVLHERQENIVQDGIIHELRLRDRRLINNQAKFKLYSDARFSDRDTTRIASSWITWRELLRVQHRKHLWSEYNYRFADRDAGPANSQTHFSRALIKHQLYKSLTSSGELQFQNTIESSDGSDARFTRFGGGISEAYTKRIRSAEVINTGFSTYLYNNEDRSSGGIVTVLDESVRLSDQTPSILSRPLVNEFSVVVTDQRGIVTYLEGFDYRLFTRGQFTEIRRVIGGNIPRDSTVLVDYASGSQAGDTYQTTQGRIFFRYALFDDRLSFHGDLEDLQNHGDDATIRQELRRLTLGVTAGPRWSKTGADYEENDSSVFPYTAARISERLNVSLPGNSSVSLDLSQQWRDFEDSDETEETFSVIGNLRAQFSRAITINLTAGTLVEKRQTEDRDRVTARADFQYRYGKLTVNTSYEYEEDAFMTQAQEEERRTENRLWVKMKRRF
ncbi:MAG: hypothetical protein ACI97B_001251 [Verrucomicrobiales bacterium]|jgi:hypothetical protein